MNRRQPLILRDRRAGCECDSVYRDRKGSPGILLIRRGTSLIPLVEYLVAVAYASEASEWQDRIEYIG